VRRDGGVSGCTCQAFPLAVSNVFSGVVHIFLGKPEIYNEYPVAVLVGTDSKVVWFDISVDNSFGVDKLNSLDHLISDHQDGLEAKLLITEVEEGFERFTKQIHNHHILVALNSVVIYLRDGLSQNSGVCMEPKINFALSVKLLVPLIYILDLHSDLKFIFDVDSPPNLSKCTFAQLSD
jgi:hypothetical protein